MPLPVSFGIMENKPRILLITSSYPMSENDAKAAAGLFVKDFAHELSKKMNVSVITQMTVRQRLNRSTQFDSGIEVIRFSWAGVNRPLSTLRFSKDLHLILSVILKGIWTSLKIMRTKKIDVILALWAIPSGLWALVPKWIYKTPYVVWCLGSDIWDYGSKPILSKMLRVILNQSSVLFADGFQLKDDVQTLSRKKCLFLPSSRLMDVNTTAKAVLMPDKKNYLFIGRYHYNKGPDILIEAIAKLDPVVRKQVYFHLFGGGPLESHLRKMIKEYDLIDVICLKGYIEQKEAAAYLKGCDALVIPSRIESIPVILSDAMQLECPVLVSDVGDLGKIVRMYKAGIIFPSNSSDKLAKAIEKSFYEKDNYAEGRKEIIAMFDLSRTVETFTKTIYENILSEK